MRNTFLLMNNLKKYTFLYLSLYMGNVCNNTVLRSNRGCFSIFIKLLPIQLFEVDYFSFNIELWTPALGWLSRAQNLTIILWPSEGYLIPSLKKKKTIRSVCMCVSYKNWRSIRRKVDREGTNKIHFQGGLSYTKIKPTASFNGFINPWKWEITVELLTDP